MRQIRILISRFFYVRISPTFCGQYIWVSLQEILTLLHHENNKGTDQPAHACSRYSLSEKYDS